MCSYKWTYTNNESILQLQCGDNYDVVLFSWMVATVQASLDLNYVTFGTGEAATHHST